MLRINLPKKTFNNKTQPLGSHKQKLRRKIRKFYRLISIYRFSRKKITNHFLHWRYNYWKFPGFSECNNLDCIRWSKYENISSFTAWALILHNTIIIHQTVLKMTHFFIIYNNWEIFLFLKLPRTPLFHVHWIILIGKNRSIDRLV